MRVHETRFHHNVPAEVFAEIPAEAYRVPSGWIKQIRVKTEDDTVETDLIFFVKYPQP